ncbi:MAG: SOS response-associated peptidase [Armatimonadetes bacterium]|nr:SOS response-associated peptidase [Armatimonadota bacterium]
MCGRYALLSSMEQVRDRFAPGQALLPLPVRYNIVPTQPVMVAHCESGRPALEPMRWGLVPFWATDPTMGPKLINARAETLPEKPAFRGPLMRRRCLIPANGFYEWNRAGSHKQPYFIHLRDRRLFAFAGLYDEWPSPDGSPLRTCTIITVEPNALLAGIHTRMPAILREWDEDLWMTPGFVPAARVMPALTPMPEELMSMEPVSTYVNSARNEGPECLRPADGLLAGLND